MIGFQFVSAIVSVGISKCQCVLELATIVYVRQYVPTPEVDFLIFGRSGISTIPPAVLNAYQKL